MIYRYRRRPRKWPQYLGLAGLGLTLWALWYI